jgi:hypothetical protein
MFIKKHSQIEFEFEKNQDVFRTKKITFTIAFVFYFFICAYFGFQPFLTSLLALVILIQLIWLCLLCAYTKGGVVFDNETQKVYSKASFFMISNSDIIAGFDDIAAVFVSSDHLTKDDLAELGAEQKYKYAAHILLKNSEIIRISRWNPAFDKLRKMAFACHEMSGCRFFETEEGESVYIEKGNDDLLKVLKKKMD